MNSHVGRGTAPAATQERRGGSTYPGTFRKYVRPAGGGGAGAARKLEKLIAGGGAGWESG